MWALVKSWAVRGCGPGQLRSADPLSADFGLVKLASNRPHSDLYLSRVQLWTFQSTRNTRYKRKGKYLPCTSRNAFFFWMKCHLLFLQFWNVLVLKSISKEQIHAFSFYTITSSDIQKYWPLVYRNQTLSATKPICVNVVRLDQKVSCNICSIWPLGGAEQ